jgi:hypothetical protein
MQLPAALTVLLIVPPRKIIAIAMAVPMMARMRAYSAAEAPLSSFRKETSLDMWKPHFHSVDDWPGRTDRVPTQVK